MRTGRSWSGSRPSVRGIVPPCFHPAYEDIVPIRAGVRSALRHGIAHVADEARRAVRHDVPRPGVLMGEELIPAQSERDAVSARLWRLRDRCCGLPCVRSHPPAVRADEPEILCARAWLRRE